VERFWRNAVNAVTSVHGVYAVTTVTLKRTFYSNSMNMGLQGPVTVKQSRVNGAIRA